jgi:phosphoribosylformylglycinamidine synthase subunit PurQ / glutaminase
MSKVKAIILRTAGTNCDQETAYAFKLAGAEADLVHINALKGKKGALDKYQIMAVPGGFTYGDDVASGKLLANELRSSLKGQLSRFVSGGKLVIGICNGFQVLVKMGLLPGIVEPAKFSVESTLCLNDSGKFMAKWVHLKSAKGKGQKAKCVWTTGLPEVIYLPIAHAEGKFIPRDDKVLKALRDNGQVVFRYTDVSGAASGYPHNPNGSVDDIAGICDPSGRILGMMPHPERHISYLQHPRWRRPDEDRSSWGIGLKIFKNGVDFARNNL